MFGSGISRIGLAVTSITEAFASLGKTAQITWIVLTKYAMPAWLASGSFSALLGEIGTTLATLGKRWGFFMTASAAAGGGIALFATGIGEVAIAIASVIATLYSVATIIDLVFGTKIVDGFIDKVKAAYQVTKDFLGLGDKPILGRATDPDIVKQQQKIGDQLRLESARQLESEREQVDALKKRRQELELLSTSFKNYTRDLNIATDQEAAFVGMNADQVEVIKAQTAIFAKAADEVRKLQDAKKMLKAEEAGLASTYDEQIAKINALANAGAAEAGKSIQNLQTRKALEADRLQQTENMTKAIEAQIARQQTLGDAIRSANDKKVDVAFEGAQAGKNPLQKQMAQIQEDARKGALEAGRTFAAGFEGMDLSIAQTKE